MAAPQHRRPDAASTDRDVLRPTPARHHRNRGALQNALRAERIARRRNFASWLLTVLVAAGACLAIVFWIADRSRQARPAPLPNAAGPTAIPALPDASMPLPAGTEHMLPAR